MSIDLHRRLPPRPEPDPRFFVKTAKEGSRVWDQKWQMYVHTDDVSLTAAEAVDICRILNGREQLAGKGKP